jgi:hypothetical protein
MIKYGDDVRLGKQIFTETYNYAHRYSGNDLTCSNCHLYAAVFTGLFLSLVIYMWYAATPNIRVSEYTARNACPVQSIIIDGNLFFGPVRHVEKTLEELSRQRE